MRGSVAAIGEADRVRGFRFAGVRVLEAADPAAVQDAWRGLGPETSVVLLTEAAQAALAGQLEEPRGMICAVIPA